ncbi:MAG: glutamate-5-semialdehyde dehydrogenase [Actinobacteria bacterium]|nr:glutamate-5-semialdehyde dehydrogenase [Actinomycetota bacterium]
MTETRTDVRTLDDQFAAARAAARVLTSTSAEAKDRALGAMAAALEARVDEIVEANGLDVAAATAGDATAAVIDRLTLTPERVNAIAEALREITGLPDPVGDVLEERTLPNGLELKKVRVPLGVIGVIYEGRPNVTVDAAGLAVKAGNAVLLRGSRIAAHSNAKLVTVLSEAGEAAGLPEATVQFVEPTRETATALMKARGHVDLLIPRGGNDLIQTVVRESVVPVIETGVGNCHVFVDATADLDRAVSILVNAKVQRPGVCNAAESFLVHRDVADEFVPKALAALAENGVEVRGDDAIRAYDEHVTAATDQDHRTEFLDLIVSAKVVGSLDEAIEHINEYGTQHTEAIVTEDPESIRRFVDEIDAAAVIVNASTRFTDGGELGMGAEIGISTQKLHARGPMALPELTTYKFVVVGSGQVRT